MVGPLDRLWRAGLRRDVPAAHRTAQDRHAAQGGCYAARFSSISACKGGISVAIETGVPEAIPYLQSGQGLAMPARTYMHLQTPARLLATFAGLDL